MKQRLVAVMFFLVFLSGCMGEYTAADRERDNQTNMMAWVLVILVVAVGAYLYFHEDKSRKRMSSLDMSIHSRANQLVEDIHSLRPKEPVEPVIPGDPGPEKTEEHDDEEEHFDADTKP